MTKVAIKNENITSFGGIYIISLWLFRIPFVPFTYYSIKPATPLFVKIT